MTKTVIALFTVLIIPLSASACTYDHIRLKNGEVQARWIPCNDEKCPDYMRHKKMIENHNVHIHDAAQQKKIDRFETAK